MTNTPENRTFNDKFMLRLPDGMRDRIKAAAETGNRSMNAEIVATLEREYPPPVPGPEDILLRIENALRSEGMTHHREDLDLLNRMLAAAGYPFRVEYDDEKSCLALFPIADFPYSPQP